MAEQNELIRLILEQDAGLQAEEEELIHMLLDKTVAKKVTEAPRSGQRIADKVAKAVGSWPFILLFIGFLAAWILFNTVAFFTHFDGFPYILLNLLLSCVAAIQAPVIMMSQNRQEEKDRLRAENDYKVNLKAELLVRDIHRKLDRVNQLLEQTEIKFKAQKAEKE